MRAIITILLNKKSNFLNQAWECCKITHCFFFTFWMDVIVNLVVEGRPYNQCMGQNSSNIPKRNITKIRAAIIASDDFQVHVCIENSIALNLIFHWKLICSSRFISWKKNDESSTSQHQIWRNVFCFDHRRWNDDKQFTKNIIDKKQNKDW